MAVGAVLARPAGPGDRPARSNKWLVSVSVLFGAMMGAIDTSVVNVALAHIQASYGVTAQEVTWVSTSYLITLVIIMPLTAWMASVLGRKRQASVVAFDYAFALIGIVFLVCLPLVLLMRRGQAAGAGAAAGAEAAD